MRVISGIYKSRILKNYNPKEEVRPTTDRAKETLFNILNSRYDITQKLIMDLFCGSGSFGIECISRGAEKCVFVDRQTHITKSNLESLQITEEKYELSKSDVIQYLKKNSIEPYLVFADPPYEYKNYNELIKSISSIDTYFILEHSSKLKEFENFGENIILQKKIGISHFTFFNFRKQI